MLDNGRRLHLGNAADATRSALSHFSSSLTAAFMTPLTAIQKGLGGRQAAVPSAVDSSHAISPAAVSEEAQGDPLWQDSHSADGPQAQDDALRQELRSADHAQDQSLSHQSYLAEATNDVQSQFVSEGSHTAGHLHLADDSPSADDSHSAGASDDAQRQDLRQDLQSMEASPPQAAALPGSAKIRVSVRAPSAADMDASPMEERLAGKHTAHAGHSKAGL